MKQKVLEMLRNADGYVSGQELCESLKVSRTAIWKVINKLKEDGYEIEAIRNKGYQLITSPDILTTYEILAQSQALWLGKEIECYLEIDSTNNRAKFLAETGCPAGQLVVSDTQTKGRGRRGRTWISDLGSMICMSFVLRPNISTEKVSAITLISALAVAEAISDLTQADVKIKWPNDILINSRKVCGILTEMSCDMDGVKYVVVGIGINVNTEHFDKELDKIATSLYNETGKKTSRAIVIARIVETLEKYYKIFIDEGSFSSLKDLYESKMINNGKMVKVLSTKMEYEGIAKGITELGELLVETIDGEIRTVISGEVSVRGIYGYT